MPSFDTLLAFFGVAVLLALTPGPDNVFVLLQSAQRGWRAGMAVVLGLCSGLVVHTAAVALGLAAVFAASAGAFTVLKVFGAAYLLWLAWQALRPAPAPASVSAPMPAPASAMRTAAQERAGLAAAMNPSSTSPSVSDSAIAPVLPTAPAEKTAPAAPGAPARASLWRMVGRGVVMNLSNPKVLIFFLAFLPQFADPARGPVAPQLMVLGVVFMLASLLVFGAIACFSGAFGALLQRSARAQRLLAQVSALVFVALAVRLATASR